MRKHLWQRDGRLKTGRISLIFFLCLLLGLGLLFKLQQPVDKAIVVVRHIFAAPPKPRPEPKNEKHNQVAETDKKTTVKPKKTVPVPQPEPVKVVRTETAEKKPAAPAPETIVEPKKTSAVKKVTPESLAKKAAAEMAQMESVKSPVRPAKDPVQEIKVAQSKITPPAASDAKAESGADAAVKSKPQTVSTAADILTEELVVAPPLLQPSSLQLPKPVPDKPADQMPVTLLTKAQRQILQPKPIAAQPREKPALQVKFAALKPFEVKKTSAKREIKPEKSDFKPVSVKFSAKPAVAQGGKAPGITVAKKEYKKLHHAWQAAGKSEKDDDHVIPLQIENLRAAYDLLQMKAVVIRPDESCIDLADGSRIPPASLDRFSSTVLRVDDPWQKWGTQLKAAGLRPGQKFKVRYYLYDFVRRSIYARVNQAYRWSLAQGLIQAKTKPDEIDVLGRTFVIKRSGGGAFGVFVPLSLKTDDGHRVKIDPVCFSNAPDINALHSAGLI